MFCRLFFTVIIGGASFRATHSSCKSYICSVPSSALHNLLMGNILQKRDKDSRYIMVMNIDISIYNCPTCLLASEDNPGI